jgi:hypothetical protein
VSYVSSFVDSQSASILNYEWKRWGESAGSGGEAGRCAGRRTTAARGGGVASKGCLALSAMEIVIAIKAKL